MQNIIFNEIMEKRIELIRKVLQKKQQEYTLTNDDRFHNFKRQSAILNITPEKALLGNWTKHLASILDIVDKIDKNVLPSNEMLEEKIGDLVNYLILLEAMIKERIRTKELEEQLKLSKVLSKDKEPIMGC